jgi:phosphoribosylanthranilate isomerase
MRIKVCGLIEQENINALSECAVDMIGLNFYPSSPRYVTLDTLVIPESIEKVGVFVNTTFDDILSKIKYFGLNYVQLHGDESADFCLKIQAIIPVIKVFRIHQDFD